MTRKKDHGHDVLEMSNMSLENTRPSTLNNKIAILFLSIILGIPVTMIIGVWLVPYISILSVPAVIVPYIFYVKWAMHKILDYNASIELIDAMKRRVFVRY